MVKKAQVLHMWWQRYFPRGDRQGHFDQNAASWGDFTPLKHRRAMLAKGQVIHCRAAAIMGVALLLGGGFLCWGSDGVVSSFCSLLQQIVVCIVPTHPNTLSCQCEPQRQQAAFLWPFFPFAAKQRSHCVFVNNEPFYFQKKMVLVFMINGTVPCQVVPSVRQHRLCLPAFILLLFCCRWSKPKETCSSEKRWIIKELDTLSQDLTNERIQVAFSKSVISVCDSSQLVLKSRVLGFCEDNQVNSVRNCQHNGDERRWRCAGSGTGSSARAERQTSGWACRGQRSVPRCFQKSKSPVACWCSICFLVVRHSCSCRIRFQPGHRLPQVATELQDLRVPSDKLRSRSGWDQQNGEFILCVPLGVWSLNFRSFCLRALSFSW